MTDEFDDLAQAADPMLFDIGESVATATLIEKSDDPLPRTVDTTIPLPFTPLTGAAFNTERTHRYCLWRRFLEHGTTVMWIMLNPSTADEMKNDPTITRCENYARAWGHARLVVGNLFSFRATDPKALKSAADPIGKDNDEWLHKMRKMSAMCVAGWGNHGIYLERNRAVLDILRQYGPVHFLKRNKNGSPGHPLYLKANLPPQEMPE